MAAVEEHTHVKDVAKDSRIVDTIAVLPVRNLIVYPHMAAPLVANRPGSIKALDEALPPASQGSGGLSLADCFEGRYQCLK